MPASAYDLWLPHSVADEYEVSVTQGEAGVEKAAEFRARLKDVDERLDLIWVKVSAEGWEHPGRWHIVRQMTQHAAASYWAVLAEDGEGYSDPEERHFEALQERDSWAHPDAWRRYRMRRDAERREIASRQTERSREFREKLDERLASVFDGRIAVTGEDKAKLAGKPNPNTAKAKQRRRRRDRGAAPKKDRR